MGISFVFYDPIFNKWYNNNKKDYQISFKRGNLNEMKIEKNRFINIYNRQFNLLKDNKIQIKERNENLDLIEKVGKLKSLTAEEIIKEKKKFSCWKI